MAKSDTKYWERRRGKIFNRKGGWKVGQGVYCHGYEIMTDLVGNISYVQMMMLNITGTLPSRKVADCVEAIYVTMSWPEPRIWCNHIGALSGTAKTGVVGATTAGVLAADSTMYGSRPLLESVTFIKKALEDYQSGKSIQEIVDEQIKLHQGKVQIVGFARPLVRGDERVAAVQKTMAAHNIEIGPHLDLAYKIADHLRNRHGEDININGFSAAFLSDVGLSKEQIYSLAAMCVVSGVTACYLEEYDKPAESFLPLRCEDIDYQGPPPREVPDP
ncbi:MAG: hypothetical protein AB1810_05310 [Pseudomonadota bacterium]